MQVLVTTALIAATVFAVSNVPGPGAIVLGGGLALSSTAVAMQVLCFIMHPQILNPPTRMVDGGV